MPLFVATLVFRFGLERATSTPERPNRPAPQGAREVEGSAGTLELAGGGRIVARLAHLHAGESSAARARQAFDARALQARLELGEGEPFRLQLSWHAAPGPAHAAEDSPRVTPELALAQIAIRDAAGTALAVLTPPPTHATQASDPLAVLLAPPGETLRPGETVELVLWGRAPGAGAALVAELIEAGESEELEVALVARALVARDEAELARVERGGGR